MTSFDPVKQHLWVRRFLDLAQLVATWSKDPSTKVGAVIVDDLRRVIATGYNGFPRGVADDARRYADRAVKYPLVVHAEANAILNAVANVRGAVMVATMMPCAECAKLIAQSGIACVVAPKLANDRWTESHVFAKTIFAEAGVRVVELDAADHETKPIVVSTLDAMTIDDARAAFAPVLTPLERAFPPYLDEVRVRILCEKDNVCSCTLRYRGSSVVVYATTLGFSYTFVEALNGVVMTTDPSEVSAYLANELRMFQVRHLQNHTQQ